MPAASILPVALYKNKLYFLFGKENPMENSASGFSDFGGGMEAGESALDAALREGSEELTGFLGTRQDLKKRLKKNGVYKIKYEFEDKNTYTIHIFPMSYDLEFVKYFNDNHAFLWGKMNKTLLNNSRLFEKIKVDWFCEDELQKRMTEYHYESSGKYSFVYAKMCGYTTTGSYTWSSYPYDIEKKRPRCPKRRTMTRV